MGNTNLLNKEQKAQELHVSTRTLDRWVKKGKVEVITIHKSKRRWFLPKQVDDLN